MGTHTHTYTHIHTHTHPHTHTHAHTCNMCPCLALLMDRGAAPVPGCLPSPDSRAQSNRTHPSRRCRLQGRGCCSQGGRRRVLPRAPLMHTCSLGVFLHVSGCCVVVCVFHVWCVVCITRGVLCCTVCFLASLPHPSLSSALLSLLGVGGKCLVFKNNKRHQF